MAATRRTLLAGLALPAAAGAVALPAVMVPASAAGPHPDAELLELGRRWVENHVAFNAAIDRVGELETIGRPEPPAAIFVAKGDHALKLASYAHERDDGSRMYLVEPADAERRRLRRKHWRWQRREVCPEDGLPEDATHIDERVPWVEAQARADEIVAAYDGWGAAKKAAEDASGYTAAEAEMDRLGAIETEIEDAIGAMTPRTLDGLAVQVRVILAQLSVDDANDSQEVTVLRRFAVMMRGAA